ncbi:MAG: response regulator transcription factor [Chloroflexi bacterium]|nr:response regulator transcription factor [Chloroflexota bacterium]
MTAEGRHRLLVVDDEPAILTLLTSVLSREGYDVETASNGAQAIARLYEREPDLVILDVRLPDLDGIAVCRTIRQTSRVPIIMLTALRNEQDIVGGLNAGADDYVTKPFSPGELVARIRAALRRSELDFQPADRRLVFADGQLTIDLDRRAVQAADRTASLTPSEFRLLSYLLANAGRVVLTRELAGHLWNGEPGERAAFIKVYIRALRHKIEPDPARPRYVISYHGAGYSFRASPVALQPQSGVGGG